MTVRVEKSFKPNFLFTCTAYIIFILLFSLDEKHIVLGILVLQAFPIKLLLSVSYNLCNLIKNTTS